MRFEVKIDIKNENALCTISMLSALLETQGGNYYGLLTPFILCSLPTAENTEISPEKVTESLHSFGFADFPNKLTETILTKLCSKPIDGQIYVRQDKATGRAKKFYVNKAFDRSDFDARKNSMRKEIDGILLAIQKYFENHFYHKTLPFELIQKKLTGFFEANGYTVINSVNDLRLISEENGSDAFQIAHFILDEYEKKSVVYDDLCNVTKGFLTYKGLYYFLSDQKNHIDSKFQDVTFYLDCSLVLDALNYDTLADFTAINELIRLVRRCGGNVAVFRHTAEEAARLIEAFANKPHCRNNFRLDSLAEQRLPKDILLAIAKDIPKTLKEKVQVDTVDIPSFTDKSNYQNILGEQDIVDWFSKNRPSSGNAVDAEERYRFDAKSLLAVGMCRRDFRPHYIEQAKAMIVTQDPWLNRCLRDLYKSKFKNEVYFAITDTELLSLLWLQDHKQVSNLPSDILIANAHAACRVSHEVMDRAIQIANTMAEQGIIPSDTALLVSSRTDFKGFVANRTRNDATMLTDEIIQTTIEDYIKEIATTQVSEARNEERCQAQEIIDEQNKKHIIENANLQETISKKDNEILSLKQKILDRDRAAAETRTRKSKKADKQASFVANFVHCTLYVLAITFAVAIIAIFGVHWFQAYIAEKSWFLYALVEIIAFASTPFMFVSKKSLCYRLISRVRDWVYTKTYSWIINEN